MLEFEILNYKTIKHIPRTTIDGYCSIQGRNHVGKSAILQAIRAVFVNPKGNDFIRHGESFTEVRIWHNGNFFCWTKERNGSATYTVNDLEEFAKVPSGSIPKEILELGYGPIQVAGEKVELYYAPQFEPLFLLDRGNSNFVTDLMAAVHKIDVIYKAMNLVDLDIRAESGDNRLLKGQSKADEESLKAFDKLDLASTRFEEALEAHEKVSLLEAEITRIRSLLSHLRSYAQTAQNLKSISEVSVPDADFAKQEFDITTIRGLVKTLKISKDQATHLQKVGSIVIPDEVPTSEVEEARKFLQSYSKISSTARSLRPIEELVLPECLDSSKASLIESLKSLSKLVSEKSKVLEVLSKVDELSIPDPLESADDSANKLLSKLLEAKSKAQKYSALESLVLPDPIYYDLPSHLPNRLDVAKEEAVKIQQEIKDLSVEEEKVLDKLKEFKNCPLCGSDIGDGHEH